MKTKLIFFPVFLIITLFSGYNLNGQTASITQGCAPLTVDFQPPAGAGAFFWDFKDGVTSDLVEPSHVFTETGTFIVEFRETSTGPIVGSITITVFETPELNIVAAPDSGCAPLDVDFLSLSTIDPQITVINYNWVFGDATFEINGREVSHTYTDGGSFNVSLSIETNFPSCNVTREFPELINTSSPPPVAFSTDPEPPVACDTLEVNFINETPNLGSYSFAWDFGNGDTSTSVNPPVQTYDEDGQFIVTLTATDELGCSGSVSRPVVVGNPVADFAIADTVCVGEAVQIQNLSSAGDYAWDFGSGAEPETSTATNPSVVFTQEGMYSISLNVISAADCPGDTTKMVFADLADAAFTAEPDSSCSQPFDVMFATVSDKETTWEWEFGDDSTSNEQNPVHTYINPDTTTYSINGEIFFYPTLTVTNPSGCSDTFTDTIRLRQPNALFQVDTNNGCLPLPVTFSDSSTDERPIVSWEWVYGNGDSQTFANNDDHVYEYTTPGEYDAFLIITNDLGCTDTSYSIRIEVGENLEFDFAADETEVCPGDTVTFTPIADDPNIDEWHFEADGGRAFHCFQDPELQWSFITNTGPMDASLTVGYNGCYSTVTKEDYIQIKGPIAEIDYLVECEAPFDVQFVDSSMEATSIMWDFGDGNTSSLDSTVHSYETTGDYTVVLTAENPASGCPASTDTAIVHVREIKAAFELDTILCVGQEYMLDATPSQDVDADCWKGFTWLFSFQRPITTQDTVIDPFFFNTPGEHMVSLETTDINGCKDTMDLDVKVYLAQADFAFDKERVCLPVLVNFSDSSDNVSDTTIVKWEWNFGDMMMSEEQNPSHTYQFSDLNPINVSLRVEDVFGCVGETSKTIEVYRPVSFITFEPSNFICVGSEIEFFATDFTQEGSNLLFNWDFGNGITDSVQNVTVPFDEAGNFTVTLNFVEEATGCPGMTTLPVFVQDFPEADFTTNLDTLSIICHPKQVFFRDATDYHGDPSGFPLWDFGNGQGAVGFEPAVTFGKGEFTVEMIATTTAGCMDTVSKTFDLVGPEGSFTTDKNMICKFEEITFSLSEDTVNISSFTWDFGDGTVVDNENPVTHTYTSIPPGNRTIAKLILTGAQGCTLTDSMTISFIPTLADFIRNDGIDTSVCIGENFIFFNNSSPDATIFNWDFGDGDVSGQVNPTHLFDAPGSYEVELAVENSVEGCVDTIIKTVIIDPLPQTVALPDTTCQGFPGQLSIENPNNNSIYSWSPKSLLASDSMSTVTTQPLTAGTTPFTVEETDPNGCKNTAETTVFAFEPFPMFEPFDTVACIGEPVVLPVDKPNDFFIFNWSNSQLLDCDDCPNPVATVEETTTFTLTVTDIFGLGCSDGPSMFTVNVPDESLVDAPNAFTPDSDGLNDFFNYVVKEEATDLITVERFQVFNRWGSLVYENENPTQGWDGTKDGKEQPADVYIYIMEVSVLGCDPFQIDGDVTLIR